MSGHSKWAQIKRKKAAKDARRGRLFTRMLKEITVAARLGGGDPEGNPRLRSAIAEAKSNSVPNDTIERAIGKGTGELQDAAYEEVTYEGYGPGGMAVLVEAATDNRNRTVSELRHLFAKHGGSLGESGCVAWLFDRRGYFAIERAVMGEEALFELALAVGAEDVAIQEDGYELHGTAEDFARTLAALADRGVPLAAAELAWVPRSDLELDGAQARAALRLLDALDEHDDVQKVWANLDVDAGAVGAEAASELAERSG